MATKIPIPKLGQSEETVTIERWKVKEGDTIKEDDLLVVLEAMKMETSVKAPSGGRVISIPVSQGDVVKTGDLLVILG